MVNENQTIGSPGRSSSAAAPGSVARQAANVPSKSFSDTLADVRFSAHAQTRLQTRQIALNSQTVSRIEQGIDRAGEKGIKESLVLLDDLAFLVNVKNRTVITVMDASAAGRNIFTNIDGAVIV